MRIWSLHPSLLDPKRLTAVWREGLLGLHCLTGRCVGYRNHPQLLRWRLETLAAYLLTIHEEATGLASSPAVEVRNAYLDELRYFIQCVQSGTRPDRIPNQQAAVNVAIVEAEVKSARTGKPV